MNQMEQSLKPESIEPSRELIEKFSADFLGNQYSSISTDHYQEITQEAFEYSKTIFQHNETESQKKIIFDKYKKSFFHDTVPVTMGQIIAARHLDKNINLSKELDNFGLGKKLRKEFIMKKTEDYLAQRFNQVLASRLAIETESRDMLKSKAYQAIADRSTLESSSEQLGVIAESVMQGFAEMIAADRPDLGITISPANAYQDVAEKVDFIVTTKTKKRGAGIEVVDPLIEERHIGIQFTVNTSKKTHEHKHDQIEKAKHRSNDFDDIVLFAFDAHMICSAMNTWEQKGKPLSGIWGELSPEAQQRALDGLFTNVLSPEQQKSLMI